MGPTSGVPSTRLSGATWRNQSAFVLMLFAVLDGRAGRAGHAGHAGHPKNSAGDGSYFWGGSDMQSCFL